MTGFKPSAFLRTGNRVVSPLIRRGLRMGSRRAPMALLGVKGRKTGLVRTVPIALGRHGDEWLVVAVYGEGDWSRNLQAAGEAIVTHRGETIPVVARRLPPREAASILRDEITAAPRLVRNMTARYFDADRDSPLAHWERESERHPVFVLSRVRALPSAAPGHLPDTRRWSS
jgi:deazaflavin-dependent oxidoreductase (nitroreductase family)